MAGFVDWAVAMGDIIDDAVEGGEATPADAVRIMAEIQSIVDPTGISSIVASYTYDTCELQDYYEIRTVLNSDSCIDIPFGDAVDGNDLILWQYHGGANQKWHMNSDDGKIRSLVDKNKCIGLESASTSNGTPIQINDCEATETWTKLGNGQIRSNTNPDKCITLKNANVSNGAELILWDCRWWWLNQKWI